MNREYSGIDRDGRPVWSLSSKIPLYDEEGTINGILGIGVDITERRLIEEQLRMREIRQRTMIENFPNGLIALYDHDLTYVIAGGEGLTRIRMTSADLEGKRLRDIFPPDIYERDEPHLLAALRGETTDNTVEYGNSFFRVMTIPVYDDDSNIINGIVLSQDITELKRTEDALIDARERYKLLADLTFEGIVIHRDGVLLDANRAFLAMFGYEQDEVIGQQVIDTVMTPDSADIIRENIRRQYHGPYEVMGVRKDGSQFPIEIEARQINDEVRVAGLRDITGHKQAQQREFELMLEKERVSLLTTFVQDAAHEFRTPLATINSGVYLMARLDAVEKRLDKARKIEDQVHRLTNLLNMLLTMVSLESTTSLIRESVEIAPVIDAAIDRQNNADSLAWINRVDADEMLMVRGDAELLTMAIGQILNNALRFTPPEGRVTIETIQDDRLCQIRISDTGPGIPEAYHRRIFETFWRKDVAHSTPGLGLGLPIAQQIIQLHSGQIEVISEIGQGTMFIIWLPVQIESS